MAESLDQVFDHDLKVVLISNASGDIEAMSAAAADDAHVIVFDAQQDNLATIGGKLADLAAATGKKIDAIALVGHGSENRIFVGSDEITLFNIGQHSMDFTAIGGLLTDDAQIQFFGCDIAGNELGEALTSPRSHGLRPRTCLPA